jgi:D-alanine-D-alanine ligase
VSGKISRRNAAKPKPQGKAVIRGSIGPVEDLESYVKADWWRDIFNANYLRTDGDVVEDPDITEAEIDAFLELVDVGRDACILDLCCGQGRHLLELARRGFTNLYGVDRSHYLISRAKRVARQRGLVATFREGDARKLRLRENTFDLVYLAGNSFGYFESAEDDIAVLAELRRLLKPAGQLLIDFTDGDFLRDNFEARSWEWIDKDYFVCRERTLSKDNTRLVSREVITHTKKGVVADQFYAERLYNADQLGALLAENGFDVLEARPMSTVSKRNQDLGMMAQRIILTARSDKSVGVAGEEHKRVRQVTVVMGDHRRADSVKPNKTFDNDDFHTIDELKKALAQLAGFEFSYVDNHDEFIDTLRNDAGRIDFVFNICDEGFDNDPTKELHVPALLEMLGIRYSGGNPQCLAYCYDKSLIRGVAMEMDIPVPAAFSVAPEEVTFISMPIDFPVIVKPNYGDFEQAIAKVREATGFDRPVLVEQFLTGKDISVGIIGNPPDSYTVLPVIEEDYSQLPEGLPRICGYEAKWDTESEYFRKVKSIPADLPQPTIDFLNASCIRLFQRVGCQDYARFDWRLDGNNTPRLLEVNPNPGWCWDGHLAKMAKLAGLSYPDMLREILSACDERLRVAARETAARRAA